MTAYRPTILAGERQHCPAWISHYEHGTPRSHDVFHTGTAAHAVLEQLGNHATGVGGNPRPEEAQMVADGVVTRLAGEGRKFDGEQQPPLPLDACMDGARLAMDWYRTHGMSHTAHYEVGIGFSSTPKSGHWLVSPYDPVKNRWRLIADVIDIDDGLASVLDYKSAWNANASYLEHLQQKAQALAVIDWANFHRREIWGVEIAIGNLRTLAIHSRVLDLDQDAEELAGWRRELSVGLDALDMQIDGDWRPARPGLGCVACPYRQRCPSGLAFMGPATQDDMVRQWAVSKDYADSLLWLAKQAQPGAPVLVDGKAIGWVPDVKRKVRGSAARALAKYWCPENVDAAAGLLTAARLGVGQLERLAKQAFGEDADAFVTEHTERFVGAKFAIGKANHPDQAAATATRKPKPPKKTRAQEHADKWGLSK